jgi:hypothetical protein
METPEFHHTTDHDFTDISSEKSRSYTFPNGVVTIDAPLYLAVSRGGHRLFDRYGQSHYVPSGWIKLTWTVYPGEPNFVK